MNQSKNSDNLHTCAGVAECPISDSDTLQNVKNRAKDLAKIDACKKIDDYIQLFFKNKGFKLPEDEISAISIEISNIVDVKYNFQSSDNDNMAIRANVTAQFDDNDIIDRIDKFFRDKSALVEQNEGLRQKLTKLEKQQDKDLQQISSLAAQNEELKQKLAESEAQYDKYRREVLSKLETQNEKLNRQLAELKSQHDRDSREISTLDVQNEKLNRPIDELKPPQVNSHQNDNKKFQNLSNTDRIILSMKKKDEALRLEREGDYEGAIKLFDEAIEVDPNPNAFLHRCRAEAYDNLGQYERAIQDYSKAIEINPSDYNAAWPGGTYRARAEAYCELGQYERAIQDYSKVIEINPKAAHLYHNRGIAYQELGNEEKAQADFAKAKKLS